MLKSFTAFTMALKPFPLVYIALTNMLRSNVSAMLQTEPSAFMQMMDSSSSLLTGLDACNDATQKSWRHTPIFVNFGDETGDIVEFEGNFTNNLFMKPSWMCRNGIVARAIKDLATNMRISMMTFSELT
jgi:hypothetical protein